MAKTLFKKQKVLLENAAKKLKSPSTELIH